MDKVGFDIKRFQRHQSEIKDGYGKPCPNCLAVVIHVGLKSSILFPGDKCRWCGYVDERERKKGIYK